MSLLTYKNSEVKVQKIVVTFTSVKVKKVLKVKFLT